MDRLFKEDTFKIFSNTLKISVLTLVVWHQSVCGVDGFLCFSGDFAVLLKAGMTVRQAILYNVLSALMAFLGMVTGILIGHYAENISMWIFALTAGLFMYVALVDMVSQHLYTSYTTADFHKLTTNGHMVPAAAWHLISLNSVFLILRTLHTYKRSKPLTEIQQYLLQYINCSYWSTANKYFWFYWFLFIYQIPVCALIISL